MNLNVEEILSNNEHRPWPKPRAKWQFYQEWNNVIFMHWPVDESKLRPHIPDELEIDQYDGKAWISLVAFTMEKVRPRYLPAFPPVSNFDEVNIRTYVRYKERGGVYFLSIEGGKWLSCLLAKSMSGLPYRYSNMRRMDGSYLSSNKAYDDRLVIQYSIGPKLVDKTTRDRWLTERYALFQDVRGAIVQFEIHHIEWPLYRIEIQSKMVQYPRFAHLIDQGIEDIHYSPGVQVATWGRNVTG